MRMGISQIPVQCGGGPVARSLSGPNVSVPPRSQTGKLIHPVAERHAGGRSSIIDCVLVDGYIHVI